MTTQVSTKDILLAAADIIEERGLAKGLVAADHFWDGPTCASLAIFQAVRSLLAPISREWAAKDAMRDHVGNRSIPAWNDAPERTRAEVVAALRGAAEA